MISRVFCLALMVASSGCGLPTRTPASAAVSINKNDYIDLEPGWRLRVVTPILKSGGYRLQSSEPGRGSEITLRAAPDFVGYENAFYSVMPRGSGVSWRFASADVYRDGKPAPQDRPTVRLFDLPQAVRHMRLIYLVRVSNADHNMAVLAAKHGSALDPLTRRLQADPDSCQNERETFCSWVPDGIAVTPERRSTEGEWTAVR